MTIAPHPLQAEGKEQREISRPVKVCMHLLGSLRKDVRGMRAATALVEVGYAVCIIDVEGENVGAQQAGEEIDGVHVKHMRVAEEFIASRFKRWAFVRAVRMFVRSTVMLLRTSADVYHALDLPALPACYVAGWLRRKPVVFEAYELPLDTLPVAQLSLGRRWLHRLLAPLLRHMLPRCAGVIAVSPPIVQEMRKRYVLSEVTLIRNILGYKEVAKSERLRQLLGLTEDVRIALYQGFLQPDRGLERLVQAAAFLDPNIVIVMMGASAGTTRTELEALIASEGAGDRVKILAPAPYAELLAWTASADIGLIVYTPDFARNVQMMLPNKLFEYLMAGLPVLASSLESVVEIIQTYQVGKILASLAPVDVARTINAMLADQEELARMRQHALQAAQEDLCWEKEKGEVVRLYKKIQTTKG